MHSFYQAQEDTEVLRSLVLPLEKNIQELSEKLAAAEDKIRKYEFGEVSIGSPNERKGNGKNLIDLSYNASQESNSTSPKGPDFKSPVREGSDSFSSDAPVISPSKSVSCGMCVNYEAQLVSQQEVARQLVKEKEMVEANMAKVKEDLLKETNFRKHMEDKWNEKKEEHKVQVIIEVSF